MEAIVVRLSLCLFNRHKPYRSRVKWDGYHFVGTCRHCGKSIRRLENGGWRKDWLEQKA